MSSDDAELLLGASRSSGLSLDEVLRRRAKYGSNALPKPEPTSALAMFVRQLVSPLVVLLFIAAAIAIALGEWMDAAVIVCIVLINAALGTLQEGRAQRSMMSLRTLTSIRSRVVRSNAELVLDAEELVPGDLLLLSAGDAVPADGRLVSVASLEVSEAALSGESLPSSKAIEPVPQDAVLADRSCMVFAGTQVTRGRASAIVVATGSRAELGKIAELSTVAREPPTALELRVRQLGTMLMGSGAVAFVAVLAIGILRGLATSDVLMVAITQLVGLVPEGLPVAITIALAVGMQRMAARGALVRRLSVVESLGATTVICTDKTGTLTRNEMTVTRVLLADGRVLEVSGIGYAPSGSLTCRGQPVGVDDAAVRALCEAVCACNDANLSQDPEGVWRPIGDPTEIALLTLGLKAGLDIEKLRSVHPRTGEVPFDAVHRTMSTEHGNITYVKGSPEAILSRCARTLSTDDSPRLLDDAKRRELEVLVSDFASRALRVLGVAMAHRPLTNSAVSDEDRDLTFLGFVGQIDPPREGIAQAIELCRKAGVRTVMVTGDHAATGLALARQLGIAERDDEAIEGSELTRLTDDELASRLARTAVFARVQPADKVRIVEAFRTHGDVVAMTGDGVNDAPALTRADVGVAMGITGTEVAKEASKIVVTDDNFATIALAIEEGRLVYTNVTKLVSFLVSGGIAEVAVLLTCIAAGFPPPFLPVQILWNNLVTEGTVTVGLATDARDGREMSRPPIRPDAALVNRAALARVSFLSAIIVLIAAGYYVTALRAHDIAHASTSTFVLLAICEWFNVLNHRSSIRSAFSRRTEGNRWLWLGLLASVGLQCAVIYVPGLRSIFHTVPLSAVELVTLASLGSIVLWVEEARKLIARSIRR